MRNKALGWSLILVLALAGTAAAQTQSQKAESSSDQAKQAYDQAKAAIYQKDWAKALAALEKIEKMYSQSAYLGESLYWLGYSLDKLSADMTDRSLQLEKRKEAIEKLNALLEGHASSNWAKDARVLRLQIAESLAKSGLFEYQKYITDSIGTGGHPLPEDRSQKLTSDEEIKLVALYALMGMDKEKAFPILEKMARTETSDELRSQALFVLSQSRDPRIIPLFIDLAAKDPLPRVREMAIFWLGQSKDEAALGALLKIYDGADAKGKEGIFFSLAQSQSPKASAKMIEVAKSDPDPKLRAQAVFWLGQRKDEAALDALLKIYDGADAKGKEGIFFSLAQSQSPKARAKMIEVAKSDPDPKLRAQAVFWLGQRKDETTQDLLLDLYSDSLDDKVKGNLIMSFAENQSPKARAKLIDIARNEKDVKVREQAVFWLGRIKGEDVAAALVDIYKKSDDAKTRQHIIAALAQNGVEKAVPMLIEMARAEKDPEVKKQIVLWLGQSKSDEALKFLRELLDK